MVRLGASPRFDRASVASGSRIAVWDVAHRSHFGKGALGRDDLVGVAVMTTSLPDKSAYRENGTNARAPCSA